MMMNNNNSNNTNGFFGNNNNNNNNNNNSNNNNNNIIINKNTNNMDNSVFQNEFVSKVESLQTKNGLAMMIPGRPVVSQFRQMSNNHFIMSIPNPGYVKQFGISITDINSFPKNIGIIIYYSLFPFNKWQVLNNNVESSKSPTLYVDNPTKIFLSPWLNVDNIKQCPLCYLGLELKPLEYIKSIEKNSNECKDGINNSNSNNSNNFSNNKTIQEEELESIDMKTFEKVAKKIGDNLYQFLSSYTKTLPSDQGGEVIVAPTNVMDRWFDRFKTKLSKDKSFLKK